MLAATDERRVREDARPLRRFGALGAAAKTVQRIRPKQLVLLKHTAMSLHRFFLVVMLLVPTFCSAQTDVSGGVFSNTSWIASASPYIVTDDIVVFDGVTLTVESGVEIRVNQGKKIEVRGRLEALGTQTDSVIFTSNASSPAMNDWLGIVCIGTVAPFGVGHQLDLNYVRGEYATYFVDLDIAYHGPYTFSNCLFRFNFSAHRDLGMSVNLFTSCEFYGNVKGMASGQWPANIDNCYFHHNNIGIDGGGHIITNSIFHNHSQLGVRFGRDIRYCEIYNNPVGIESWHTADTKVIGNYVHDNDVGVDMMSFWNEPGREFLYNSICNNATWNLRYSHTNNANLSQNCWCSVDSTFIRSKIRDAYVDVSYGIVTYMPIYDNCDETGLSVSDITNAKDVVIYPNPTNGIIFIESTGAIESVTLVDLQGRVIMTSDKVNFERQLDMTTIASGSYLLLIKEGNTVISKRIVVQ